MAFLNCRPSVIAAALLYVERRSRGIIPFWPSMLAKLTGYQVGGDKGPGRAACGASANRSMVGALQPPLHQPALLAPFPGLANARPCPLHPPAPRPQDMSTPELSVAIKAAQRMCGRGGGIPRPVSIPRSLSRSGSAQALANGTSSTSSASSSSGTLLAVPGVVGLAAASVPVVPTTAGLPTTSAAISHGDLAAAVAAAAAAASGISVSPLPATSLATVPITAPIAAPITAPIAAPIAAPLPLAMPAAMLPRAASAERALSTLRQPNGLSGSPTISPPPAPSAGVAVPAQLLQQHLVPLADHAVSAALANGVAAFPAQHP